MIQQACVLTGRDRSVRQHIREARLATHWVLADWDFEWTVNLDRGKVRFERRPASAPDVTLTWPSAAEFLTSIEEGRAPDAAMVFEGKLELRNSVLLVYKSFCRSLEKVMANPVDDAGNTLV